MSKAPELTNSVPLTIIGLGDLIADLPVVGQWYEMRIRLRRTIHDGGTVDIDNVLKAVKVE